ncbi:SDR family NAD(P)-dependent oxidoreductase [Acidiphilium sp.]|uniref:SDR family NAD(P)-dependent oxidoreductase n=1 Tax=Acidiphilium sp. TaxID=527 RepID=UPI003D010EA1
MERILEGRLALVTGASRGVGAATAIALARMGAHVVIAARDDLGLTVTDDAIRAAGGEATLLPADLIRADVTDQIGASLYQRFGRLDIMVHAAGAIGQLTATSQIDQADWDRAFGINVAATWRLIRSTEPLLRAAGHGRVVVLTHEVASTPRPYWALAGASMAARQGLVLAWAAELIRTDLRVNLFDPVAELWLAEGTEAGELPPYDAMAATVAAMCLPSEGRHGVVVRCSAADLNG